MPFAAKFSASKHYNLAVVIYNSAEMRSVTCRDGFEVDCENALKLVLMARGWARGCSSASIALLDHLVTNCLLPGHAKEMDEVMESLPLMVGVVCSSLFLVFPNTRYGIACMTA
ncbi:hypothetical protein Cni_G11411 [Canna indica]|uniref:Uncharacterized protein n=1 Tax=Canna indica TaxID=4628 RepID=A0AAQ3K645_9LILI|nr:hypothetical protein Cni_G11411 [Canna indica]